jgi:peptidoglycan/xylan/chitin deacetylase (PgdA/CDA1 family)
MSGLQATDGMNSRLLVTTSWDDGYPADLRIAELLAKFGVAGTFYVPNRNSEGRPVMNENEVRQLAGTFEVGGHSIDHVVLTTLDQEDAARQINENKRWLEDLTGRPVPGFAYVRGRYNGVVKDLVRHAGFEYARTVENLRSSMVSDPYELPTTIQLFPHGRLIYVRNFLRAPSLARARLLTVALAPAGLPERVDRLIGACRRAGGYFHLWGHSWEIEEHGLWGALETVLRGMSEASDAIEFVTNHEAHRKRLPAPTSVLGT